MITVENSAPEFYEAHCTKCGCNFKYQLEDIQEQKIPNYVEKFCECMGVDLDKIDEIKNNDLKIYLTVLKTLETPIKPIQFVVCPECKEKNNHYPVGAGTAGLGLGLSLG